ncbi:MAG: aminotransferase class I/II-fold pyridoxal phosphate-dependent enzyme [Candidatus Micrarchaeota archaeon]|nr:aminotransferase class I/II-fold pyridoxal phosphate-dependent enzyme [Candidatus Micrarchaeota archaeon]
MLVKQARLPKDDARGREIVNSRPNSNIQSLCPAPFSRLAWRLPKDGILLFNKKVGDLVQEGYDIKNLGIGQLNYDTPANVREKMKWALDNGKSGYSNPTGIIEARKAAAEFIEKTRGIPTTAENICILSGGKPGIPIFIQLATNHGDGVLYPVPGFPGYYGAIYPHGRVPVEYYLRPENDFQPEVDEIEDKIKESERRGPRGRIRAIILNGPSNPTGMMYYYETLAAIAQLALEHGIRILTDEVYSLINYGKHFFSIAQINDDILNYTALLESGSKAIPGPGYRFGFMVAWDPKLIGFLQSYIQSHDSCVMALSQYGLAEGFSGNMDYTKMMVEDLGQRRELAVSLLNGIEGFRCHMPDGAFYAYAEVTEAVKNLGLKNSEELASLLLMNGVAGLPHYLFGKPERGDKRQYMRFSFSVGKEIIEEGLNRVKNVVEGRPTLG